MARRKGRPVPRLKLPEGAPVPIVCTRPLPPRRHRGGAWKVAYADFVTALMALFIVLWMMNSSQQVKQSVAGYFRDPRGYTRKLGAGPAAAGEGVVVHKNNVSEIRRQIEQALRQVPEFQKMRQNIKFSVTGEGLRIDLLENEQGLFFVTGSAEPTEAGAHLLAALAGEVGKMPNRVVIEGHTDARPFRNARPASGYSNWELSADRANGARRLLHQFGIRPQQVVEVRGFADQRLMIEDKPEDPRNRRVSLVVKFTGEGQ
jgi:chemotaxis protein MotB